MRPIFSVLVAPDAGSGPTLTDRSRAIFFFQGGTDNDNLCHFYFFHIVSLSPVVEAGDRGNGYGPGERKKSENRGGAESE